MANKGILGRKLGMTQVFDDENRVVPVTVIEAGPCRVVQIKTPERDGYAAVQLAYGETKVNRLSKPELGHLRKADAAPAKYLAELRVDDLTGFEVGQVLAADVFAAGERVDVTGISKGHGFSGVMKRHNFKGQGASHGNHKKHRAPGSIGACATPARVFKGLRMAGQYGNERVTTLNLTVVEGDAERNLILVKGAVPGPAGGLVFVRSAVKAGR
ncbi:MAG: 50S ribosomal protein L3 [Actinomycetota bacterium]